jgi:WD40 repeat protein
LRIYDACAGTTVREFALNRTPVALAWSPSGKEIAAVCRDDTLAILDAETGDTVREVDDCRSLVSWRGDQVCSTWGGKLRFIAHRPAKGPSHALHTLDAGSKVVCAAWNPAATAVATGGSDGDLRVVEPRDGSCVQQVDMVRAPQALAWSPSGASVATCEGDTLGIVDVASGKVAHQVFKGETVTAVAWSPSGAEMLAAGSGPVRILSPSTGKVLREVAHDGAVAEAAWCPTGAAIATRCTEGKLRVIADASRQRAPSR